MQQNALYLHLYAAIRNVMSKISRIIYIILAAVLTSCSADFAPYDTIYDNNVTMGNFIEGEFITDQGLTYNVLNYSSFDNIDTVKRAMISCDIVSKVKESIFNVYLTDFEDIFTKSPLDSTAVIDQTLFQEDPITLGEIWYSGGYLNMLVSIPVKTGSTSKHIINLIRNDANPENGTYEFSFKHNANGEVITAGDTDFIQANRYVSFPISQLFNENEQKVKIILKWTSNQENDGKWTHQTMRNKISLDVERIGYEHKHWE